MFRAWLKPAAAGKSQAENQAKIQPNNAISRNWPIPLSSATTISCRINSPLANQESNGIRRIRSLLVLAQLETRAMMPSPNDITRYTRARKRLKRTCSAALNVVDCYAIMTS
jgi:hypothetical protein